MMSTFIEYVTKDGDRWDLIAYRMYGDANAYEPIIVANPDVPITPVLPGGLTILVPLREQETVEATDLPPWKRATT
jgi:phage tail protein X